MQNQVIQEALALGLVGLVALGWIVRIARRTLGPGVAQWLLNRGQVKWAMKIKGWSSRRASPVAKSSDGCHD